VVGRAAPVSDWRGTFAARGPRSAVAVKGDLLADAASETETRTVGRVRFDGTLDLSVPIPVGTLTSELEHVDLAAVAGPRLPTSDLTGRIALANDVGTPRAFRFDVGLDGPRVAALRVESLRATGGFDDDEVRFVVDASSTDGAARVTGTVGRRTERFDLDV